MRDRGQTSAEIELRAWTHLIRSFRAVLWALLHRLLASGVASASAVRTAGRAVRVTVGSEIQGVLECGLEPEDALRRVSNRSVKCCIFRFFLSGVVAGADRLRPASVCCVVLPLSASSSARSLPVSPACPLTQYNSAVPFRNLRSERM